jgi:Cu+-exporting ATPase
VTQSIKELSDDELWSIVALMEKDFKHPLATLLFKEGIARSTQKKATFVGMQPTLTRNGIMGTVIRTDKQ